MLEASDVNFAGNVVVPELILVDVAATPADIVLLRLREDLLHEHVCVVVPDLYAEPTVHRTIYILSSDQSSMIAQMKLCITKLQGRFTSGGGEISVPNIAGSRFATMSSALLPSVEVDFSPSLAALPQV